MNNFESENDLQHPVLKKAKRRGTLTKEDEKNLPFEIKLKCGKAGKAGATDGGLDFRSLLKHVKARVVHGKLRSTVHRTLIS